MRTAGRQGFYEPFLAALGPRVPASFAVSLDEAVLPARVRSRAFRFLRLTRRAAARRSVEEGGEAWLVFDCVRVFTVQRNPLTRSPAFSSPATALGSWPGTR